MQKQKSFCSFPRILCCILFFQDLVPRETEIWGHAKTQDLTNLHAVGFYGESTPGDGDRGYGRRNISHSVFTKISHVKNQNSAMWRVLCCAPFFLRVSGETRIWGNANIQDLVNLHALGFYAGRRGQGIREEEHFFRTAFLQKSAMWRIKNQQCNSELQCRCSTK